MEVKSVITSPSGGQKMKGPGLYQVSGLAWSGFGKIRRVDVSADGGKSWAQAALDEPVLSKALVRFRMPWRWDGSPSVLMSRAVDETGAVQPTRAALIARARRELPLSLQRDSELERHARGRDRQCLRLSDVAASLAARWLALAQLHARGRAGRARSSACPSRGAESRAGTSASVPTARACRRARAPRSRARRCTRRSASRVTARRARASRAISSSAARARCATRPPCARSAAIGRMRRRCSTTSAARCRTCSRSR